MKLLLLPLAILACISTEGQILKKLKESKAVSNLTEGKKPITTSFKDVDLEKKLDPSFGEGVEYSRLHDMPKNANGEYVLKPGYYSVQSLSYCLKAGTNGPAQGDAYGLAPLDGKMADIVYDIINESQRRWQAKGTDSSANLVPSQRDVQLLLWAIIAKADFENMAGRTKIVAAALLTPKQLLKLNGGAVKTVTNFATDKGWVDKPLWMRKIEEAEQSLRQLYANGNGTYEDFERLAILAGLSDEPQPVEAGTWFFHKNGYYIRFEPSGYSRTTVKVYVPDHGSDVNFRVTGWVATPSDSRQRLAQTDISVEEYGKKMGAAH